jgi:hypothetical protein
MDHKFTTKNLLSILNINHKQIQAILSYYIKTFYDLFNFTLIFILNIGFYFNFRVQQGIYIYFL